MRRPPSLNPQRDEGGLTAVIEFLSAFTLFLMILTAFLSLAQLQMGSNDPDVDRLDRAAVLGIDRLTSGMRDGLFRWRLTWITPTPPKIGTWRPPTHCTTSVQPGIMTDHRLDFEKIQALSNVTEEGMAAGLGLASDMSLHLSIKIVDSGDPLRVGTVLFSGGTERGTAPSSSTAYRFFQQGGESIHVVLEVHDGGRKNNALHITEVMARPTAGGPEWIEVYNPNDFAVSLKGWSFNHTSGSSSTNLLLQEGVLAGGSLSLFTGDSDKPGETECIASDRPWFIGFPWCWTIERTCGRAR